MRTRLVHACAAAALLATVAAAPAHAAAPASAGLTERARTAATSTVDSLGLLRKLRVTKKAPSTSGYSAKKFAHWTDADKDSCDTRAEVLKSESRTRAAVSKGCTVTKGAWRSAYDGKILRTAASVRIDHLVGLKEAWRSGAKTWTSATRRAFANDLAYSATLVPTSKAAKKAKGHKDPASWLPSGKKNRCAYAAGWTAVKYRWNLSVDAKEKKKLAAVLTGCSAAQRAVPAPTKASVKKATTTSTQARTFEKYLTSYVNAERTERGLKALKRWSKIDKVAKSWSKKQAASGKMRHNPRYTDQIDDVKRWRNVGENVAWSSSTARSATELKKLARRTVEGWMNSPGHRKNILSTKFTHVGTGSWVSGSGWYSTQNFARFF